MPSPSLAVPGLDPIAAARWRQRPHNASPWLHEEVAARMLQRLDWIRLAPQSWVHWAALLGGQDAHQQLLQRYPQAQVWLAGEGAVQAQAAWHPHRGKGWLQWSQRLLGRPLRGTASLWPPAGAPEVDMVWANMALHLHPEPAPLLQHWLGMLRPDGFLMFSALGPDSLQELRQVHHLQGWPDPTHPLTDMHDWGDMLVETGWAEPVLDQERLTLTYPSAQRLLDDLRSWGRNLAQARFAALRGRGYQQAWLQAVERSGPRNAQGQLQLTLEIVYGHAVRPRPKVATPGTHTVSLQDMRAMLRQPAPR